MNALWLSNTYGPNAVLSSRTEWPSTRGGPISRRALGWPIVAAEKHKCSVATDGLLARTKSPLSTA
jgi:hypothetical protein